VSAQIRLDDSNLPDYLRKTGLLPPGGEVAVEPVGDGNINWVRRARCVPDGRSWVVKQARPALERFPQYRVSTRRIATPPCGRSDGFEPPACAQRSMAR
jgi:hypothetical protein